MKKILVVLLALAVLGGLAFAQDAKPVLTFGQYSDIETDLTADSFAGSIYNETYLNFKASDMLFSATVVAGADYFAAARNYKLSYTLLDGMVTLAGGKLREGPARLASYIEGNGFSTRLANVNTGLMVTVKPIADATLAVFIPANANDGATVPVALTASDNFQKANVGVQYNLAGLANFVAGYRMENKELWVGADVKALEGITAKAGFKMVTGTSSTSNYIYLTGGMSPAENIGVGLDADVGLATATTYGARVHVTYAMAPLTFGLKASYDNGDAWNGKNGVWIYPYAMMDFAAGDLKVGLTYDTGSSTWSVPIEMELSY